MEFEAIAAASESISKILFDNFVKKDLERGEIGGKVDSEILREKYSNVLVGDTVWEILVLKVEDWKRLESLSKNRNLDDVSLRDILIRHKRIPTIEKISEKLGTEKGESYRASLEKLESKVFPKSSKGEIWKMNSLEIVHSLIVNVIGEHYSKGDLKEAYDMWKKQTYSKKKSKQNPNREMSTMKAFWKSTGIWVISKGNEESWNTFANEYGPRTKKKIQKLIKMSKEFKVAMLRNRNNCMKYIPKRKPNLRLLCYVKSNIKKIEAYLNGCNEKK